MGKTNFNILLALVVLVALFPFVVSDSYNLTIGVFAGTNALLALGLCILMGFAGQASLGQAGFYGIGAYVSAILSMKFGLPVALSMVAAAAVSGISAILIAVPALRLKGHYLAVATLGFGEIVYVILNELGPGGPSGFGDIPHLSLFGFVFDSAVSNFYLVWSFVILIIIFSFNLVNSRIGRAMKAIHDSEVASNAMGLDVASLKIKVFILSAIYASFAGSFYGHFITFLSPSTFSLFQSILVLMMVIFGGASNLWGAVVGAIIITILPEALRRFDELDVLIYGIILTLSLLFMRKGLVPLLMDKLKTEKRHA
ncbi:MAG: branched-chain amino acid ABC transporter permease [bacterium]